MGNIGSPEWFKDFTGLTYGKYTEMLVRAQQESPMSEKLTPYAFLVEAPDGYDHPDVWVVPVDVAESRIAALEAENDELREEVNRQEEHINGLADTRLKIEQENERLREEAKRISRIRDHHYRHQAMDAALKEAE